MSQVAARSLDALWEAGHAKRLVVMRCHILQTVTLLVMRRACIMLQTGSPPAPKHDRTWPQWRIRKLRHKPRMCTRMRYQRHLGAPHVWGAPPRGPPSAHTCARPVPCQCRPQDMPRKLQAWAPWVESDIGGLNTPGGCSAVAPSPPCHACGCALALACSRANAWW